MTIRSEFGLHDIAVSPIQKYVSPASAEWKIETINNSRAVGIEIEVENHELQRVPNNHVWVHVEDGSLRNRGMEWVTTPIAASDAPAALHELLRECLGQGCCFGPRTSVHVHVNAQDLMPNQVKGIVQLYCVFEKMLYNFVGKGRSKNIFCVPLYDTSLMREFQSVRLPGIIDRWSKYAGLNLLPLSSKGTLEFRHMHGCSNPVKLCQWIRLILRLFDYVINEDKAFAKNFGVINPKSDFEFLLKEVFKEDAHLLRCNGWEDVKEGVISMQQMHARSNAISAITALRVVEAPFYKLGV